jgi:hypothetical protein
MAGTSRAYSFSQTFGTHIWHDLSMLGIARHGCTCSLQAFMTLQLHAPPRLSKLRLRLASRAVTSRLRMPLPKRHLQLPSGRQSKPPPLSAPLKMQPISIAQLGAQ